MNRTIFLFTAALAISGCVEPSRAVSAMESAGYTNITVTDRHDFAPEFAGCSESDGVAFDVTATNPAGKRTTATVCCGYWLKGCTIRH